MIELHHGDCLEIMPSIPDKSIDMILCDLPYGTTACKWDVIIPFEPLWKQYERIIKDNGAVVLFGAEPFSTHLRMSRIKKYKYDWVWNKVRATGNFLATRQPMRVVENVIVFYSKQPVYNSQIEDKEKKYIRHLKKAYKNNGSHIKDNYSAESRTIPAEKKHPNNIITISGGSAKNMLHPTAKPVELMEYLIKTYTNEGETVLDNCMGSGTTGVACKNLNRNFIGIEKDEKYFKIAEKRIY